MSNTVFFIPIFILCAPTVVYSADCNNDQKIKITKQSIKFIKYNSKKLDNTALRYKHPMGLFSKKNALFIFSGFISREIAQEHSVIKSYSSPIKDGIFWKIYVKGYFVCCKKLETRVYYIHRLLGDVKNNKKDFFNLLSSTPLGAQYRNGLIHLSYDCNLPLYMKADIAKKRCKSQGIKQLEYFNNRWKEFVFPVKVKNIKLIMSTLFIEPPSRDAGEHKTWSANWVYRTKLK